jgi:hypothetical protein
LKKSETEAKLREINRRLAEAEKKIRELLKLVSTKKK